jgi:hypothetical protein
MKKHIGKILLISIACITSIIYFIVTLNINSAVLTSKKLPKNNIKENEKVDDVLSNEINDKSTNGVIVKEIKESNAKNKLIKKEKPKYNNSSNEDLDIKSKIIEKEAVNELD